MKGLMWFGKRGKLAPCYIRPFPIVGKVRNVSYKLELLDRLKAIHLIFHISLLRKYTPDESHVVKDKPIQIDQEFMCEEKPIAIID